MFSKQYFYVFLLTILFSTNYIIANKSGNIIKKLSEQNNNYSNLLLLKYNFNHYSNLAAEKTSKLLSDNSEESVSRKSPWLAFFLSMCFPTTGQIYNGDYTKAIIQAAFILTGGGLVAATACVECGDAGRLQTALFITGAFLGASGYIWSIIDAPVSANEHNARIKSTSGINIYKSENNKYSIRLNKLPIHEMYGLSLVVEL